MMIVIVLPFDLAKSIPSFLFFISIIIPTFSAADYHFLQFPANDVKNSERVTSFRTFQRYYSPASIDSTDSMLRLYSRTERPASSSIKKVPSPVGTSASEIAFFLCFAFNCLTVRPAACHMYLHYKFFHVEPSFFQFRIILY